MPTFAAPLADTDVRNSATEIAILWLTAGLGCDGDTIAMTADTPMTMPSMVNAVWILFLPSA